MNPHGWVETEAFLGALHEWGITMTDLERIVREDNKGRYQLSEDLGRIRALYGHSLAVEMDFPPLTPPETLYHGTAEKYTASIERSGLSPRSRQYVHLSCDTETALMVGARHGAPVLYRVDTAAMVRDGYVFYHPIDTIWLTSAVPAHYLTRMEEL